MQHHPGSWYLPWGVGMPLQKMMGLPFQHPVATGTATYGQAPGSGTNGAGSQVTCAMLPGQANQQHSPNSMNPMSTSPAQNYQHAALHATQLPMGSYNCPNAGPTLSHAGSLLGNGPAAAHAAHMQNTQALHQAAAAMFTPMSLRSFLASATNHPLTAMTPHQSQLSTPCNGMHPQASGVVAAAQAAAAAAVAAQQITCVPSSLSTQQQQHALNSHHQQHTLNSQHQHQHQHQLNAAAVAAAAAMNLSVGVAAMRHQTAVTNGYHSNSPILPLPIKKQLTTTPVDKEKLKAAGLPEKRKAEDSELIKDLKKAKLETKALKAKRPGFTDERYHETSYYIENGLRKVYPYYFTFTTFTKGRWVGEKILDVFAREFRAHPAEEYERCIKAGTLTVNYDKVPIDYRLKHNDLLANIVHRHEVPVTSQPITIVHMDDDIVVVNKPASIPVHPCGRYRHNTVVFILAKEYNLKNLRTIHRLDRLTSGLLLFGRSPKKARQMEHQIRNRQVQKEYICRVEGNFPEGVIECNEPIEVVSYKIGVCKVSAKGKDCTTTFQKIAHNGKTSVVLCKPLTGRMHQIRVHLQYLGYPVVNDPLYNHEVFGPLKGKGGDIGGKTDEELVRDLINIHNAENWLGIDGDSDISSMFKTLKPDCETEVNSLSGQPKSNPLSDDDSESVSRETSPCLESPRPTATDLTDNESNTERSSNLLFEINNTTSSALLVNVEAEAINNGNGFVSVNANTSPKVEVTVATQTGHEAPDMAFHAGKMTTDKHCYECKVRYRDPKPKDLIMYLHAWKYKGPGWEYETQLPSWSSTDWKETSEID